MENKCYAINLKTHEVKAYVNKKVAQGMGNGSALFTNIDELAANVNMSGDRLVLTYNKIADKPVKKFSDKKTGVTRLFKLVVDTPITPTYWDSGEYNPKLGVTTPKEKKEVDNVVQVKVKSADAKKGRSSSYAGKTIRCLVDENPRRQATHGFHSMALFINAGGKGATMSYEDYITQGGRRQDLAWDIEKGNVELVESK